MISAKKIAELHLGASKLVVQEVRQLRPQVPLALLQGKELVEGRKLRMKSNY